MRTHTGGGWGGNYTAANPAVTPPHPVLTGLQQGDYSDWLTSKHVTQQQTDIYTSFNGHNTPRTECSPRKKK